MHGSSAQLPELSQIRKKVYRNLDIDRILTHKEIAAIAAIFICFLALYQEYDV